MTDANKISILAVDDQPQELLAYQTVLDGLGYELFTASNGTLPSRL